MATSGASNSSFDDISVALKELEDQCREKINSDNSGRQWFKSKTNYEELSNSVCDSIKQLDTDWMFLSLLFNTVYQRTDSDDPVEIKTVASVARDIASNLRMASDRYSLQSRKHLKFLKEQISDCQIQTEHLMEKIGETVKSWSRGSFVVLSPPKNLDKLLESVLVSLKVIIDVTVQKAASEFKTGPLIEQICALIEELKCIQGYLGGFLRDFTHGKCNCYHAGIEHFQLSVASLVIVTALRSCNYWINKKRDRMGAKFNLIDGLVDLQHRIDTTDLNIINLNLEFLRHLDYLRVIPSCSLTSDYSRYFGEDLAEEVKSLVILFFVHKRRTNNEVRQSLFAEINAVLVEAESICGCKTDATLCAELFIKIYLLKVELFLMVHFDNAPSLSTVSYEIGEVAEFLEKLRIFSKDLPQEKINYGQQTLALIQWIASLYHSYCFRDMAAFNVKDSLPQLFYKIVIFKAESFLMGLLMSNATLMAYGKDQIESLLEELRFFKEFLTNQPMNNTCNLDETFQQIEAVARGVTIFSYSFLPENITELRIEKMIASFAELFNQLKHIKAKLREISQFTMPNIPKTCKLLFIEFPIRNIGELLKSDPNSIGPVKHYIIEIQQHLESLKSFLMRVSELDVQHPELKDLGSNVVHVAYKVDYVIDLFGVGVDWHNFFRLVDILQELRLVTEKASRIHMITLNAKGKNVIQVSSDSHRISPDSTQEAINETAQEAINETAMELRDQEEVIIDRLTRGSSNRDIISIVGMPGIGKTTLARKVYNSQHVMHHFHCHAWCTVSQVYDKRELLLDILTDIHGLTDEIHGMGIADLEAKLRQCLLKNKYLIVMDDVWDIGVWNDLQISFPDDRNGSRILITTRLCDVALEMMPNSDPHHLRPFSDDESWKLLEMKIFNGECCPEELLLVGKDIAQQCKGLPIAVVAISGLLKRTEKRKDWWEKIAQSLSSQIINDPGARCMEILELSYRHLPEYLKACFLYLGAFLEDRDIPVTKLIRFWLAEGFIRRTDSRSLELVAEDQLMDLINRSLVIISKRRSNGKVKACRLHDLIRDFCRSKVKEENFLKLITRSDEPYASFSSLDYGFEFESDHHFDPVTYNEAYRLSIFLRRNHFVNSKPSGLGTRSLIFFASTDSEPRCPYNISFICQNFKFLRVLDLECINMGISFPDEIGLLVQLRYLAVSGYVSNVPRSMVNLQKLETLVVKGFRGKVILPDTIWHMSSLRHLHVGKYVAFNLLDNEVGSSFQLENLISFSCPALSYGEETENIFKRLPNLCKLRCIFLESWDYSKNCNFFPRLNFLPLLESLKIFYLGKALNPGEFILPLNLRKLTLSHFRLPWSHISAIGRLPKLEVLKLSSGAFEGRRWDMGEEEFQELKFLKLDTLNIAEWNASSNHLPKLERLVLHNCKDLQEIPCDFDDITTLEMIEVHWCRQSAEQSAKEIGEATGEIKVIISHSQLGSSA